MRNSIRNNLHLLYKNNTLMTNEKVTEEIHITDKSSKDVIDQIKFGTLKISDLFINLSPYDFHTIYYQDQIAEMSLDIKIKDGLLHNDHGPSLHFFYHVYSKSSPNKHTKREFKIYTQNGILDSESCLHLSYRTYDIDEEYIQETKASFSKGRLHSYNNKPAHIYNYMSKYNKGSNVGINDLMVFYKNGFIHNDNGPAKYTSRENKAARDYHYKNNTSYYYKNNYIHRLDGPAVYSESGTNQIKKTSRYYIFGKKLSQKEYVDITSDSNFKKEFGLV